MRFQGSFAHGVTVAQSPESVSAAQLYAPNLAGTWEIGFCGEVFSTSSVDGSVSGWVVVTN